MCEWGVTPDYIVNNWTEELFVLMVDALATRKERETESVRHSERVVSGADMFRMIGAEVKGGH